MIGKYAIEFTVAQIKVVKGDKDNVLACTVVSIDGKSIALSVDGKLWVAKVGGDMLKLDNGKETIVRVEHSLAQSLPFALSALR